MYYASQSKSTDTLNLLTRSRSGLSLPPEMESHTLDLNEIPVASVTDNSFRGNQDLQDPATSTSIPRLGLGLPEIPDIETRSSSASSSSRKSTPPIRPPLLPSITSDSKSSNSLDIECPVDGSRSISRQLPWRSAAKGDFPRRIGEQSAGSTRNSFVQGAQQNTESFVKESESLLNMPTIEMSGSLPVESDAWRVTAGHSPPSFSSSSTSAVSISYVRADAFVSHRDTLARLRFLRRPAPYIPPSVLARIRAYLSFEDYKSIRLASKTWLRALLPPSLPSLYFLPTEVIQLIYRYLRPQDFDTARHTCRAWLLASLDRSLLASMLKQGGYWHAAQLDLELRDRKLSAAQPTDGRFQVHGFDGPRDSLFDVFPQKIATEEWLLSKRLATECMLASDWRGSFSSSNGLLERFRPAATLDFGEYIASNAGSNTRSANSSTMPSPLFTISGCGNYVLLNEDCIVSIYQILDQPSAALKATTTIHYPGEVRAVSMDTSCGRYAIAALLDCRIGIVCDIQDTVCGMSDAKPREKTIDKWAMAPPSVDLGDTCAHCSRCASRSCASKGGDTTTNEPYANSKAEKANRNSQGRSLDSSSHFKIDRPGIPIETSPRAIYRNLGSPEDPPRSVAICPQRRCVAFGCGLGVELHWVDAMSEADLNRWFPLAAPADFLFFLPPRHHQTENPSKLRLISSAAGKAQFENIPAGPPQRLPRHSVSALGPPTGPRTAHSQFMTRLFFGNLPTRAMASSVQQEFSHIPSRSTRDPGLLRTVECDHYRAVPLADGIHMLYTDPETGLLCLGSDAPLGSPTKLLRKVVFVPPEDSSVLQITSSAWPLHYTAGSDLQRGVRIVASYNNHIVLYSLPADIFEEIRKVILPFAGADNLIFTGSHLGNSDLIMDTYIHGQEKAHESPSNSENLLSSVAWGTRSIRVQGVSIGYMEGAEAFSVQCSHGGVRVWAFASTGKAYVWDIENRTSPEKKIMIRANGIAEAAGEPEQREDVLMEDDLSPDWDLSSPEWETPSSSIPSPTVSPGQNIERNVNFFDGASKSEGIFICDCDNKKSFFDEIDIRDYEGWSACLMLPD